MAKPKTAKGDEFSLVVDHEKVSIREKTLDKLREAIISGYFQPGERLVERDICARTNVSRTSLREALRHLESEGLVESRTGQGVFVRVLTYEDIREIYELRMAIDSHAARRFPSRAKPEHRQKLAEIARELRTTQPRNEEPNRTLVNGFFLTIHEGAGNKLALSIIQSLRSRLALLRALTNRMSGDERHVGRAEDMANIAAEILEGDPDKAAEMCRSFVQGSLDFAAEVLTQLETNHPEAGNFMHMKPIGDRK